MTTYDITSRLHGGNAESAEANESIEPDKARMRQAVLRYIESRGLVGATCDEVEHALRMRHQTASARLTELKRAKQVVATERRRPTWSGRMARVYAAAGDDGEVAA
ncbi:MAG TPA: hypothetical protein VE326_11220 [Candidatus Binatia bacterium]|nr:hypothetical protein [Candidatus Binatia bacterium]